MIASFGDLIKVPVQIEESEWSCVFVLEVSSLPLSTIEKQRNNTLSEKQINTTLSEKQGNTTLSEKQRNTTLSEKQRNTTFSEKQKNTTR
jgi:hypothetical protein